MPTTIEVEEGGATRFELPMRAASPTAHESGRQSHDQPILSIRASVPRAEAEVFIAQALQDIRAFMQEHHVPAAGPPFSICRPRGGNLDIEAGWPTTGKPRAGTNRIHSGSLPRALTGPQLSEV